MLRKLAKFRDDAGPGPTIPQGPDLYLPANRGLASNFRSADLWTLTCTTKDRYWRKARIGEIYRSMWRMKKIVHRDCVTLRVSGHLQTRNLVEIKNALADEGMSADVVLDLSEVTLISREAVAHLARFEVNRIDRRKCPAYIRDWIAQERKRIDACRGGKHAGQEE